jgi:hypothetical protein
MNPASSKVRSSRPGIFPWLYPLRTRLEAPGVLVVEAAPLHYVARGLISGVLIPLLLMLLFFYVHHAGGDLPPSFLQGLELFLEIVGAVLVLVCLGVVVAAPLLSRRTVVRFDRGRGVVERPRDGVTVPLAEVAGIGVREGSGLASFSMFDLVLVRADGTQLLALHGPIAGQHTARAQATRREIEAFLGPGAAALPEKLAPGISAQPTERTTLGFPPNVAAGLCYVPIGGIGFLLSIIMLCSCKDRRVRFAAKQSLVQLACWLLVIPVALAVALALAFVVPESSPARIPAIILFVVTFSAASFGNVGAYIVACVQAFRGRVWVMPWLRWLIGKSAP